LLENGYYPKKKEQLKNDIGSLGSFAVEHFSRLRTLSADARFYHNAGSTIVQELGYSLAAASEYLSILIDTGLEPKKAAQCLFMSFATGSSYFLEIAKFRAARILWANLLQAYGIDKKSVPLYMHGETSVWNKTLYDPYTNMLRTTTEAMSAAIGGCDSITVHPFDAHLREPDAFAKRIARNQQIILEKEAYLDKVSDPSAGSFYIEKLTDALGKKAWDLFKEIEAEGGLFKAIENGTVQSAIQESQQERNQQVASRKKIFVGTNQYSKPDESSEDIPTTSSPTVSLDTSGGEFDTDKSEEKSVIEFYSHAFREGAKLGDLADYLLNYQKQELRTVHPYRGSIPFEALRQATEQHGSTPIVLTLPLGNRKMRKARAAFASNFFGSAGYNIEEPIGFSSVEDAVKSVMNLQPDVVVLCSSDKEYRQLVPKLCQRLKALEKQPMAVVAGSPGELEGTYRD
jgi:methylmalonyl-CoA mutase